MSNNQFVIQTLIQKRDQLIDEKKKAIRQFNEQISEVELAINTLSGGKVATENMADYVFRLH